MPSKNSISSLRAGQGAPARILPDHDDTPVAVKPAAPVKTDAKPIVQRVKRGFQIEVNRADKWNLLVAQMKNKKGADKRNGPQLIDEALDFLFKKYLK